MPDSVWDTEVQITLDQASKPGVRLVYVGNRNVEVLTPFPSPIDWRDIWIYFMMVDRYNYQKGPQRLVSLPTRVPPASRAPRAI